LKWPLLVGTTVLALSAPGSARCVPFDFTYTGSLVSFTVPTTGTYQILAFGAQGGDSGTIVLPQGPVFGAGGRGAEIGGDFSLTAGEILQIAVGGAGMSGSSTLGSQAGGGGGGGSFVVGPGNAPLVIAGGGGGGGLVLTGFRQPGEAGLTGPNGGGFGGGTGGSGGGNGSGGGFLPGGGGGGGFFSAGASDGGGGDAFPGLAGGVGLGSGNGGFGGGGGSGGIFCGGGGGGYSGGAGAGFVGHGGCSGGGGGGSFDAGTNQILVADFQTGNGEVVITELAAAVPEPGSLGLLGMSLALLAALRRRRP
jgi:PEP-CTERM motif